MDYFSSCNLLPVEMLIAIFKFLDPPALCNCMHVNKKWREVAVKVVSTRGLWQVLVEKYMLDSGNSFRKNSNLNWCGIYMNAVQWYDVKYAEINKAHKLLDGVVTSLFVYRDILILVFDFKVKYFNIEKFKCVRSFSYQCKKYEESDDIIVTLSINSDILGMHGKSYKANHDCIGQMSIFQQNVLFHRLEDNKVYVISNKIVYLYTWINCKWHTTICARLYGPTDIITGIVHNKEIYILTEGGKTFQWRETMLYFETYRKTHYSVPTYMDIKSFGIFDKGTLVIIAGTTKRHSEYIYDKTTNAIILGYPGLTSFTQHANVLLLGFNSGEIKIVIPLNMLKYGRESEKSFYMKRKDPILGLQVYEAIDAHHLFVRTSSSISYFKIPCLDYTQTI